MNHKKVAIRFVVIIFWTVFAGIIYTAVSNIGNAHALGWITWLSYTAVGSFYAYCGYFLTKHFWNYFK